MNTLFANFIKFRGERKSYFAIRCVDHKMYKYCDAVQKRFDKFIEKAKLRTNMDSC